MKRRRFTRTQWSQWLMEFAESNQSVRQFCRQRDLPENSFYRWRKILGDPLAADFSNSPEFADAFVQLEVAGTSSIEIRLPCGAVISSPAELAILKPLLETLCQLGDRS